jgi:hypothetical protein
MDMDCLRSRFTNPHWSACRAPLGTLSAFTAQTLVSGAAPALSGMHSRCQKDAPDQVVQVVCLQPKMEWLKLASRRNKAARQDVAGTHGKYCRPAGGRHLLMFFSRWRQMPSSLGGGSVTYLLTRAGYFSEAATFLPYSPALAIA